MTEMLALGKIFAILKFPVGSGKARDLSEAPSKATLLYNDHHDGLSHFLTFEINWFLHFTCLFGDLLPSSLPNFSDLGQGQTRGSKIKEVTSEN